MMRRRMKELREVSGYLAFQAAGEANPVDSW
jgi:hypothetical protein